jgi:hypothetical protein
LIVKQDLAMSPRPWSESLSASVKEWSDRVAILCSDALFNGGLIRREDLEQATAIISEEVFVRLCLLDYPPAEEPEPPSFES